MTHVYLAQWEWVEDAETGASSWQPPHLGFCVGQLDLRSVLAQQEPGVVAGYGIFAYEREVTIAGARSYGTDPYRMPTAEEGTDWKAKLDLPETPTGVRLVDILFDTLGIYADPTGVARAKPILPTSAGMLELHLGGFSLLISKRFTTTLPEWTNIRAVLQEDYRIAREAARQPGRGVDRNLHRKMLGAWKRQYRIDDHREFIPSDLADEGWLAPETTLSDNFNRADEDPIAGWGEEGAGDYKVVSNEAAKTASSGTSSGSISINGTLSTADHYAEANMVSFPAFGAGRFAGPIARKHATLATRTAYWFCGSSTAGQGRKLAKNVSGTLTTLASDTTAPSPPATWRCEANGSTIRGLRNGTQIFSVTDTAITGNTKAGLAHWDIAQGTWEADDFVAEDLAAGGRTTKNTDPRPLGIMAGMSRWMPKMSGTHF